MEDRPKLCGSCGKTKSPLRCPCKSVFYCSTECQKACWRTHRCECTVWLSKQLDKDRQQLGPDHPDVAQAALKLGGLYRDHDNLEDAETHFAEALRVARLFLGDNHPVVAECAGNLGNVYRWQGKLDKALETHTAAMGAQQNARQGDTLELAKKLEKSCTRRDSSRSRWRSTQRRTPCGRGCSARTTCWSPTASPTPHTP
mmetsp:Transcript_14/g.37  ORF Transcript_14/g.37 Transcript_14/m.37 type:complete len:200 (-) Transcript_14:524-1123(-)